MHSYSPRPDTARCCEWISSLTVGDDFATHPRIAPRPARYSSAAKMPLGRPWNWKRLSHPSPARSRSCNTIKLHGYQATSTGLTRLIMRKPVRGRESLQALRHIDAMPRLRIGLSVRQVTGTRRHVGEHPPKPETGCVCAPPPWLGSS